ncbi:MAG: hypothetical protein ACLFVG_05135 [Candidatus Aminicenantes bacterium]
MPDRKVLLISLFLLLVITGVPFSAGDTVTSPREYLGFRVGDDYHLADYTQLLGYWRKLEQESDRMKLEETGRTAEGRPIVMAIILYDSAGWTLAYQMGIDFDRILEGFDGPFEKMEDLAEFPAGQVITKEGTSGYLLSHRVNDAFVADAMKEKLKDGTERPLPREKFYAPGSILRARVDNTNPLAYGMPEEVDISFRYSPVFRLLPEASLKGVQPVAWFPDKDIIRSGWVWGEHYLSGGVVVIEAQVGRGKLFLYGPEIAFRGQSHGTFKFLFNGIYYGKAELMKFR